MELIITDTYNELSREAARIAVEFLQDNPTTPTVIPTGNTPLGMYRELIQKHNDGEIDLTNYCYVQLDEYAGIKKTDRRNLYRWMRQVFLDPIGIEELQATGPWGGYKHVHVRPYKNGYRHSPCGCFCRAVEHSTSKPPQKIGAF